MGCRCDPKSDPVDIDDLCTMSLAFRLTKPKAKPDREGVNVRTSDASSTSDRTRTTLDVGFRIQV
jgi:hypothetical protein